MKILLIILSCLVLLSLCSVFVFADESQSENSTHYTDDGSGLSQTELTISIIFMIVLISVVGVMFAKVVLKNSNKNRLGRK